MHTGIAWDAALSFKERIDSYTASSAFFEALIEAGVKNCFVNLGSDHPSILEAILQGQQDHPDTFPA
ncbi:unnamed protein product [Parascedosporium putredinis]|uniref:Uncharacterized protein n=1 Tax=Parascedosporium putredinis TaxID=1442378 RepID=A0A9P1GZI9_9PEZI|nr:unnamed protein product [Parascedosporium putredinis]CAI7990829.1 unnamed protein product [Parascedosporium putredinis]